MKDCINCKHHGCPAMAFDQDGFVCWKLRIDLADNWPVGDKRAETCPHYKKQWWKFWVKE